MINTRIKKQLISLFSLIQEKPLEDLQRELLGLEEDLLSLSKKNLDNNLLHQSFVQTVKEAKEVLETSKVYIIASGIGSSGKSTFLNSLLGSQLLPTSNNGCTKKYTLIQSGETIKINSGRFNSLGKASQRIQELQSQNTSGEIIIQTPSIFHKTVINFLKERVIFLDTPFNQNFTKISNCIRPIDIQIHLFFMETFYFQCDTCEINERLQQAQELQKASENVWIIILNKLDKIDPKSFPSMQCWLQDIENDLNQEQSFKISARDGLRYRIMTYGTEMSQYQFVKKFFQQQSREYCVKHFKNNINLIQDHRQQYEECLQYLNSEIKRQFELKLSQKIDRCCQCLFFLEYCLEPEVEIQNAQQKQEQEKEINIESKLLRKNLNLSTQTKLGIALNLTGGGVLVGDMAWAPSATMFTPLGLWIAGGLIAAGVTLILTKRASFEKKQCHMKE